jgi:hypothetical protein
MLDSVASVKDLRSSLRNNWLISAGLRLSLGGHSGRNLADRREAELREARARDQRAARTDSILVDSVTRARASALATARERRDTVVVVIGADTMRVPASDTLRVRERATAPATTTAARTSSRAGDSTATRDFTSERVVTIPVPTQGELYVRYGPPIAAGARTLPRSDGRLTTADPEMSETELRRSMRAILREEVAAELTRADAARGTSRTRQHDGASALTDDQLASIERRVVRRMSEGEVSPRVTAHADVRYPIRKADTVSLAVPAPAPAVSQSIAPPLSEADVDARVDARLAERIDQMVERRVREELARRSADLVPERVSGTPVTRVDTVRMVTRESRLETGSGWMAPGRITAYSGGTLTSGRQALLGLRMDVGSLNRNYPSFRLVPELALGFGGGGRSTMLAGNVQYRFPSFHLASLPGIAPHVAAGLGLLDFSDRVGSHDGFEAVLNLGYGATVDLWPRGDGAGPALLVEHQGIDVYDISRLLVGLTWRFR